MALRNGSKYTAIVQNVRSLIDLNDASKMSQMRWKSSVSRNMMTSISLFESLFFFCVEYFYFSGFDTIQRRFSRRWLNVAVFVSVLLSGNGLFIASKSERDRRINGKHHRKYSLSLCLNTVISHRQNTFLNYLNSQLHNGFSISR